MYDSVYLGLEKLKEGTNPKKALLLITDGEDNRSRYTFQNVKDFVKEQDVQIYAIGIVDEWNSQLERRTHRSGDDRRTGGPDRWPRILPGFGLRTGRHLHEDRGRTEEPVRDRLSFDEWSERRKVAQASREGESSQRHRAPERALQVGILRADGDASADVSKD